MILLNDYLQEGGQAEMPDARSEEYRYSRIIQSLHGASVDIKASASAPALTWKTDYIFAHGSSVPPLPGCKFSQLDSIFARGKNYFKDTLLTKSDHVCQLELDNKRPNIDLTFFSTGHMLNASKVHVRVRQGVQAQLNLHTLCEDGSVLFPFIFVELEERSKLEVFYWPQSQHNEGILCPWIEAIAQTDSQVIFHSFAKDITQQRLTFFGYLLGEKSDISLHSSFHLEEESSADMYVRIFHESANSTSNQYINAVTLDSAGMNFNGQIAASPTAKQILAYQMFKGLLLGEKSHITARPQLDIEYYDLACSHGVSIGGFTEEELFYLQSRGLDKKDIYPLLLYGFLSEPFTALDKEGQWRKEIKKELSIS